MLSGEDREEDRKEGREEDREEVREEVREFYGSALSLAGIMRDNQKGN